MKKERLVYKKPELSTYGNLKDVTMGGAYSGLDAGNKSHTANVNFSIFLQFFYFFFRMCLNFISINFSV